MYFLFLAAQETPVEEINFGMLILKMLFFLGLVVALIYFLLRKVLPLLIHGSNFRTRSVRIIERVPVDQRRSLLVVEIQEKVFLLGSAEGQINVLMELDPEKINAKTAEPFARPSGFDQVLKKVLLKKTSDPPQS